MQLFWNEITTVSTTRRLKEGTYFDGYKHRFKVKWIEQKASGGWTAPQELTFVDSGAQPKRAHVDSLTFRTAPGTPQSVDFQGQSLSLELTVADALPVLAQDQTLAIAAVPLFPVPGSEARLPFPVVFRAAPITQPHVWDSMQHHGAAIDDFTVTGWNWEQAFPTVRYRGPGRDDDELLVAAMNSEFYGFLREPDRRVEMSPPTGPLWAHLQGGFVVLGSAVARVSSHALTVPRHDWLAWQLLRGPDIPAWASETNRLTFGAPIANALVVNERALLSAPGSGASPFRPGCIVQSGNLTALIANDATGYRFVNLSTSTGAALERRLATGSVTGLLDRSFQRGLSERLTDFTHDSAVVVKGTTLDFAGAYGMYLSEVFFHVPFLVANHLNSQQRFEESQRWYHYIFNPMAQDSSGPWRYREFANLATESLREALTRPDALATYRNDPFNPHAIARLRLSAYQKAIVMKYIDNLLDWGDQLFDQFTMESVNEATMLYVLAADILGERPSRLPKCMQDKERSYDDIKPRLNEVSDFLIEELEQFTLVVPGGSGVTILDQTRQNKPQIVRTAATAGLGTEPGAGALVRDGGTAAFPGAGGAGVDSRAGPGYWSLSSGRPLAELYQDGAQSIGGLTALGTDSVRFTTPVIDFVPGHQGGGGIFGGGDLGEIKFDPAGLLSRVDLNLEIKYTLHDAPPPHKDVFEPAPPKHNLAEFVPARNIFCFPVNSELLAYHERVQDRLNKIRNCMDIAGVRRRLALFAPEIDPRLLVRMKAAGLSLEEVLDSSSGQAPPYRFTFLVERARQYATTVQSFGAQLLSVMEKRDGEELAALRNVHERQLLDLRTQSMRLEIDSANDALQSLRRQQEGAQLRQQYFESLLSGGLIASEQAQQSSSKTASDLGTASATIELIAAVVALVPELHIGIAAAADTGGRSLSNVFGHSASALRAGSTIADWAGKAAGMQASFDRRAQDWRFQEDIARKDVAQLAKQIEAAEIRVSIAEQAVEVHNKSIDQAGEVYDYYRSKFSGFGLYTWLSTQLNRYYRVAFDGAWQMARVAERALHFERPELSETVKLNPPSWLPERAGLLAGEVLLLDLQRLEASHLLSNTRQIEIPEESFSLATYYPEKLIDLRQTGMCDFDIPELHFDLSHAGHYFRRIKAVRLSMPCVVGPHTSLGATLRMTGSLLRDTPNAQQPLTQVPLRHALTVAASNAQGDAGVFEFNFRDERLLPFEGMGAISSWNLRLPQQLRPFDYKTISDVVLRVSYTAREDDALRDAVDAATGEILTRLRDAAPRVAISLRHDFPAEWAQFKQGSLVGDRFVAAVALTQMNYPFWLRQRLSDEEDVGLVAIYEKQDGTREVTATHYCPVKS